MFDFLKPKRAPSGPVDFVGDIEIEKPAADVYALLDWADPRNAQRQLGNEVKPAEGAPGRFEMTLNGLPGHLFEMEVVEDAPHTSYAFTSAITPILGRLATSREHYRLEPLGEGSCRVELTMTVNFVEGMRLKEYSRELMTMTVACHNALSKLKIYAEEGVGGVRAVEDRLVV